MGMFDNLPFQRGSTYFGVAGGATASTLDDTSAANLVGREYIVQDNTYNTGSWVRLRICRNDSGGTLQPSRLVKFAPISVTGESVIGYNQSAAGALTQASVVGYAAIGSTQAQAPEKTAVVDDLLRFNVPSFDLFYVVVQGPCLAYASITGADYSGGTTANQVSPGDYLHAATGVTTGAVTAGNSFAATAGRFAIALFGTTMGATSGAGPLLFGQFSNILGRAMSSCTSMAGTTTFAGTTPLLIQAGFGMWA